MAGTNRRRKVLMIGIDAGNIDFIRASLADLPNLRRLLEEGAFFPLTSPAEYMPGAVWPTFYTGTPPGEHGISQHIQWDPGAMRMRRLSADWFQCEPFWYDLERRGLRVAAIDVPFAFPSRLKRGVEINNWGSHDLLGRFEVHPAELGREIRRRFGKHPMGYEIPVDKTRRQLEAMRQELLTGVRIKAELSRWLLDSGEWDFFLTVFGETHRGGHILWRDPDDHRSVIPEGAFLDVYRAVDAGVGHILEGLDLKTTTLIVFSLHGMGSNPSQGHFMRRVMERINGCYQAGNEWAEASVAGEAAGSPGVIRRLRESMPPGLQHAAARMVPVEVRDWIVGREVTGGLDWPHTPGFAVRSDLNGFVRLNLRGRERDGMLEPGTDACHRYRDWVAECLLSLELAGTGDRVVRDLLSAQEVLPGARSDLLPDLVVRWADQPPTDRLFSDRLGEITTPLGSGRGGEHRPNGFALMLGDKPDGGLLSRLGHTADFAGFVRGLFDLAMPG